MMIKLFLLNFFGGSKMCDKMAISAYILKIVEKHLFLTQYLLGSESLVSHWGGGIHPPCFFHLFVSLEQQNLVHE